MTDERFLPLEESEKDSEFIAIEASTFAKDVLRRFKKNKRALVGLLFLVLVILFAIFVPVFGPFSYDMQDFDNRDLGPTAQHWFGTDKFGRDTFVRVMFGIRISLTIGFGAALINLTLGVVYGGISGFLGGRIDMLMMRVVDIIYAVPSLLYIILISLLFGSATIQSLLIGMSISGWIGTSRLVRTQILSLKSQEYALAAQVCGASPLRILFRHLLINALGPIIVQTTLMVPQFIFMEAFLSFLGIGISAPQASLGSLAQDARTLITVYPLQMFFPVITICLIIFSLNFIGAGLGGALNPKSGGRD